MNDCANCGHSFESHTNGACVQGCYECSCYKYVEFSCTLCEELRVVGPDHRNTIGVKHDETCPKNLAIE